MLRGPSSTLSSDRLRSLLVRAMRPLTGTTPNIGPTTVIDLGPQEQHILIDGAAKMFDLEASVHSIFDILPVPSMSFPIHLSFGDALRMSLTAELVGLIDWKNLHGADFMIHAVLEQDIIAYLIAQLTRFLKQSSASLTTVSKLRMI